MNMVSKEIKDTYVGLQGTQVISRDRVISEAEREELQKLINLGYASETVTRIAYFRGIKTAEELKFTLMGNISMQHDARLLIDVLKGVNIIKDELINGGTIINYTDYDDDGVQSGVVWHRGINMIQEHLGTHAKFNWYTNDRFEEGFGVTVGGVKDLLLKYPDTTCIITTDNGIVAYDGVEYAKSKGIKVIITDHHEPRVINGIQQLPNADAVIDPKRIDDTYPFQGLCGAGVIYKFLQVLCDEVNTDRKEMDKFLCFVAMSTIGDLVPMIDENRVLVKTGIDQVCNETYPVWRILRELLNEGKNTTQTIDEDTFGFTYCPMVNALGRLTGRVDNAIKCFISDNESEITSYVKELIKYNADRKERTRQQIETANKLIESDDLPNVIVLWDDSFEEGIVGLIAGQLKEKYNRPAFVFAKHGDVYKGSARSISGFSLDKVLLANEGILEGFGGHELAAGASVASDKIWDFFNTMQLEANARLSIDDYKKKIYVDKLVKPQDVNEDILSDIKLLKPYGMNFERPIFGLQSFYPTNESKTNPYIGVTKQTVKLIDSTTNLPVIMFKHPDQLQKVRNINNPIAIGCPVMNIWNKTVYVNGLKTTEPIMTPQFQVTDGWLF